MNIVTFSAPAAPGNHVPDVTLLALGTSTEICSVALFRRRAGAVVCDRLDSESGPGMSGGVLTQVDRLLRSAGIALADLDTVGFDAGPGAFTGLRIGCGVAQGLGFALEKRVVPVGALEAIALGHADASHQFVAIDARMGEVYCAVYRTNPKADIGSGPVIDVQVLSPDGAIAAFDSALDRVPAERVIAVGNAFDRLPALADWARARGLRTDATVWPDAGRIAAVAEHHWHRQEAVAPDDAAPVYVRNKVALDATEQALKRQDRLQALRS